MDNPYRGGPARAAVIPLFIPLAVIARAFCRALLGIAFAVRLHMANIVLFQPQTLYRSTRKDVDLATDPRI